MMKKGEVYTGTVERVDFPNKGIVRVDGQEKPVIVKNVIPGQKVSFSICKSRGERYEGRLLEVEEKSPLESVPACEHFGVCGGCIFQTMDYNEQLKMKASQVKKLLDDVIRTDYEFEGIKASPDVTGYRNKMEYTFGDEFKDGPLALGLHKRSSMYDIVTCDGCLLVDEDYDRILNCVHEHMSRAGLPFFHKVTHKGYLRHLLVRKAVKTGDILIDLITTTQMEYSLDALADELKALDLKGHITGFLHTYNDSVADAIKNERTEIVFGQDFFYEELLGLTFRITPFSFFQTNSLGAEVLYSTAREYIGTTKDKTVFDLYSGTGTIAQLMAPVAKKVIGVEIVEEAVVAARENAAHNGLTQCEFIAGDVLKVIDDIKDKPDIIILDPPRDGIHPKALPKILSYGVDHIVYISCKASSLARDLVTIQDMGYSVEKACCVDMFPMTGNVETVVKLSLKKDTPKIEVTMEPEEESNYTPQEKATYSKIKEYVKEKYGVNVHTSYIAQVKRMCGLDMGENYNKSKKGNPEVKQCPQEKVEYIKDALRHYGLI